MLRVLSNSEKVLIFVAGGVLFSLLDRLIVNTLSYNASTQEAKGGNSRNNIRSNPMTELSQRSILRLDVDPNPGLVLDKFTKPPKIKSVVKLNPALVNGKTVVYSHNGDELVRLHEFCTWAARSDCVMLHTIGGPTPIHIHDVKWDVYVSGNIKKTGHWEAEKMKLVMAELKKNPEYGFLDLGSHVGAYSLNAAKLGRKVVSVDPLIENVQRLCKSIQKGGFTEQMTIVFNPLSDSHTLVSFTTISHNIGATTLTASSPSNKTHRPCDDVYDHPTAMLDDLIPLVPFKKAVMKMDVEEHEYHVVNGGQKFLKEIDVVVIFMEWGRVQKLEEEAQQLITILEGFGYKAYEPRINGGPLDPKTFATWPFDVLWRKT